MLFCEQWNGKHEFSKTMVVACTAVLPVVSLEAGLVGSAKVAGAAGSDFNVQAWPLQQVCLPNCLSYFQRNIPRPHSDKREERHVGVVNTVSIFARNIKRIYNHLGFSFDKPRIFVLLLSNGLWILQNLFFPFDYFPSLWLSS